MRMRVPASVVAVARMPGLVGFLVVHSEKNIAKRARLSRGWINVSSIADRARYLE